MPYGKSYATLEETNEGRFVVIRVKLPDVGELAKSNRSTNLTDPTEWCEVFDQFGQETEMQFSTTISVSHRRAAAFRRMGRLAHRPASETQSWLS